LATELAFVTKSKVTSMEKMESVSLSDGGEDEDCVEDASETIGDSEAVLELPSVSGQPEVPSDVKTEVTATPVTFDSGLEEENGSKESAPTNTSTAELEQQVLKLETQRGQLASEILSKENLVTDLELKNARLNSKVEQLETQVKSNEDTYIAKITALNEEMSFKISNLNKSLMAATREKESMVMKFAVREKDILISQKKAEEADRKMKAAVKEREEATNKMKTAVADKVKFQAVADSRLQDVCNLRKEVDRWKEEVRIQEAKAASHNSRLRTEVEAHCETRDQLDKTIKHLAETRAEIDATRKECQEFMDKMKTDETEKQRLEEEQIREQKTKLIIDQVAADELTSLKEKHSKLTEEHASAIVKTERLEAAKEADAAALAQLRDSVTTQKAEIVDLYSQVAELESLKLKLASQNDLSADLRKQLQELESDFAESEESISSCKKREGELLEFTQRLTETNATLQSELTTLKVRWEATQEEHSLLSNSVLGLETGLADTQALLDAEKRTRSQETDLLARKLAEKSKQVEILNQKAQDAENEVQVLKRKHASSLKELTRELNKYHLSGGGSSINGAIKSSSRSSSSTSINNQSGPEDHDQHQLHLASSDTNSSRSNLSVTTPAPPQQEIQVSLSVPPDQALVEKMIRLQRTLARKQEKIDFMEEHSATLVEDIKKKNRLIQNYILNKETSGALTSSKMDQNKKMLSDHGSGIMSSLYSSKPNDTGMTLDLSLEINQKLQAVLEDTLLKNITLKENIDTLGNEIACMAARQK